MLQKEVWERTQKTSHFQHNFKLIFKSMFNDVFTFSTLRPNWEKMRTGFLNNAENLTTYGCALRCSQIVHFRPYSFNTTTAFYFATECSDVTVFVRLRAYACHHVLLCITWPWPGLDSLSYTGCSNVPKCYGLGNNSVKNVSVTLLFYLQPRY